MNTIPTDGEVIAYIVLCVIALLSFGFFCGMRAKSLRSKSLGVNAEIGNAEKKNTNAEQDKIGG